MGFLKSIGPTELIIILLIIVMIFGVGKLPQVASSIGKSLKAFKEGQTGAEEEAEAKPRRKQASTAKASTTATKKAAKKETPSTKEVTEA
jgi:sec-independent protein translocase protein TatA